MTAAEKRHLDRVAALGCVICRDFEGAKTPACIHHVREGQGMSQRSTAWLAVPLCPAHHQHGGAGVAFHADSRAFEALYGSELDMLARTVQLLSEGK